MPGLEPNRGLNSLYLAGNNLGRQGVQLCIDLLRVNKHIKFLHVGANDVPVGQRMLWDASFKNKSVTVV